MTASPSATVFNELAAEIEILPEGTASRVLYKDDQIRVVVFTFDTDQDLTEHSTPMAAIVQMVSGRIDARIVGTHASADAAFGPCDRAERDVAVDVAGQRADSTFGRRLKVRAET